MRIIGTLGVYFRLEYLRFFIYKIFASLCRGYLVAAPLPYIQDAILNLPNPYFRSTTVLLDVQDIHHFESTQSLQKKSYCTF